ncbi:hypothetical protein DB346_02030 [Verrucomicrobia bacterium LW23]|nr:hypothetical protein DB346_02030 [Verrucomicrobia bacterium LW23]
MDSTLLLLHYPIILASPPPVIHLNSPPRTYHCEADWRWSPLPFVDHDVWVVLRGEGALSCHGHDFSLRPGSAFILLPGARVVARHRPDRPLHVFAAHFSCRPGDVPSLPECADGKRGCVHVQLSSLQLVTAVAEACAGQAFQAGLASMDQNLSVSYSAVLVQSLVLHILAESHRRIIPPGQARVETCVEAVRREPGRRWTPAEMARMSGFSVPQFNRHFHSATGLSPARFVIMQRVERAAQLLVETDLTIAQIAEALGYSDVYFFYRQFRQVRGVTPGSLRHSTNKAHGDGV